MDLFDRLSLALPRLRLLREEPLAAHTSFRIGGPAEKAKPSGGWLALRVAM